MITLRGRLPLIRTPSSYSAAPQVQGSLPRSCQVFQSIVETILILVQVAEALHYVTVGTGRVPAGFLTGKPSWWPEDGLPTDLLPGAVVSWVALSDLAISSHSNISLTFGFDWPKQKSEQGVPQKCKNWQGGRKCAKRRRGFIDSEGSHW